jgi:hypothetical protein
MRYQVCVVSGVAALELIQSPADNDVVFILTLALLVVAPSRHVVERVGVAHARPLDVARFVGLPPLLVSRVVVPPPFGVNFWTLNDPVPVVVTVPPMTPVPAQTSTSTIVAAVGIKHPPLKLAATKAVPL